MIEAILSMFTDSIAPKTIVMWLRRRISYKNRIAKSKSITCEEFMNNIKGASQASSEIKKIYSEHKATTLLLVAYPIVDEKKCWQCTGIDENNKFLFELNLDLSRASSLKLNENEIYRINIYKD